MSYKNRIINHDLFKKSYQEIQQYEKTRIFCKHDMIHFLDVARLMMILNIKENLYIKEDVIYAVALLHDIGRCQQYQNGRQHHLASAEIAQEILQVCDFSEDEKQQIINAILKHRDSKIASEKNLYGLLYRADKLSRNCFCCEARTLCNWSDEKKNLELKY